MSWRSDCGVIVWVPAGHPQYTRAHFGEQAGCGSPAHGTTVQRDAQHGSGAQFRHGNSTTSLHNTTPQLVTSSRSWFQPTRESIWCASGVENTRTCVAGESRALRGREDPLGQEGSDRQVEGWASTVCLPTWSASWMHRFTTVQQSFHHDGVEVQAVGRRVWQDSAGIDPPLGWANAVRSAHSPNDPACLEHWWRRFLALEWEERGPRTRRWRWRKSTEVTERNVHAQWKRRCRIGKSWLVFFWHPDGERQAPHLHGYLEEWRQDAPRARVAEMGEEKLRDAGVLTVHETVKFLRRRNSRESGFMRVSSLSPWSVASCASWWLFSSTHLPRQGTFASHDHHLCFDPDDWYFGCRYRGVLSRWQTGRSMNSQFP